MSRNVAALILAAGGSKRLGEPKQLVRYHGEQLMDRAVRIAHEAGVDTIFIVFGADHVRMLEALTPTEFGVRLLINKGWRNGMSTSIALGVAAAERAGADDLLVLSCDQVTVTPEHLQRLVETSKREYVVASQYRGRRGIPAVFPEFSFRALSELVGDTGAREVLQQDSVLTVPLEGGEFDVDTPADLETLRLLEREGVKALEGLDPRKRSKRTAPSYASTPEEQYDWRVYTRERALRLLQEWTTSPSLLKHALAVEACTRSYGELEALKQGLRGEKAAQFADQYSMAGLLHDFDYDRHPSLDEHPYVGNRVLTEQGWPEPVRHAIMAHADYTNTPRESHLDRALFACDELAGFLTACALVKPTKSIHDVEVDGVLKKMKDKAFARAVSRDDMLLGAELLGLPMDEHISNCLAAMQAAATELELEGVPAGKA
jgi:predicted hydrolase (HD superfamily)/CTP:molybdopterin cytidylyltransferase MocA